MLDFEQCKRIIKSRVSCIDVADTIGYKHNKYGRGICPFHSGADNPSSFRLFPVDSNHDGGYYCNSCHEAGDVISFVQRMLGLTYPKAIKWFNDTYDLNLPEVKTITAENKNKLDRETQLRKELYMSVDAMTKLYYKVMENNKVDLLSESESIYTKLEKMLQSFKKI